MEPKILQIRNTVNYFISSEGYCFKSKNGKDVEVEVNVVRRIPYVLICGIKHNLGYLMAEYFLAESSDIGLYDRVSFKFENNRLILSSINIKRYLEKNSHEQRQIFQYGCDIKVSNHNNRVDYQNSISSLDILNALKRSNFKCLYCGDPIKPKKWHLDHVIPLSLGGKNTFTNIAATCIHCNMMKGAFGMDKFLSQCKKITRYNSEIIS